MKLSKEQSQTYLNTILEHVSSTLKVKAVEYIRNDDYMHNFNQGAKLSGKLREEVMEDYRLKHVISRNDLIDDLKNGKLPTEAYILEKYGDIINYYVLEFVSLMQRIENSEPELTHTAKYENPFESEEMDDAIKKQYEKLEKTLLESYQIPDLSIEGLKDKAFKSEASIRQRIAKSCKEIEALYGDEQRESRSSNRIDTEISKDFDLTDVRFDKIREGDQINLLIDYDKNIAEVLINGKEVKATLDKRIDGSYVINI